LSCANIKKRCERKTIINGHPKGKKKKCRPRVIKKLVCKNCPPLNGQQLLQGLAGAIGAAGLAGPAGLTEETVHTGPTA
jgi:hypothetical protein